MSVSPAAKPLDEFVEDAIPSFGSNTPPEHRHLLMMLVELSSLGEEKENQSVHSTGLAQLDDDNDNDNDVGRRLACLTLTCSIVFTCTRRISSLK